MITTRSFAAMLLASSVSTALAQQTKIWVNQVAEYSELASCAVGPISTIVRGMAAGCGDGGAFTSYGCFCYTSSAFYNGLIATSVSKKCSGTMSDVVSALEVFQSYCDLGATMTTSSPASSSTSSSATISAAAASTPPTTTAPATVTATVSAPAETSSAAASVSSSSGGMSGGAKAGVAIGVIAIVVAIAGLIAFFLFQRRRRAPGQSASHLPGTTYLPSSTTVNDPHSRPPTGNPPPVPFQQKDWNPQWQQQHPFENGSPAPSYNTAEKTVPMMSQTLIDMQELSAPQTDSVPRHELAGQRQSRHELGS